MFKTCQFCGKVYKTYYSNSMFCSISCSKNAKIFLQTYYRMKLKIENELLERKLKENDR